MKWGKPPQARKWHIFDDDGRSLCRSYGFFGADERAEDVDVDEDTFNRRRECVRCGRKAGFDVDGVDRIDTSDGAK